jgi:monofunctional biosynthetic peptidoglycan transglycosylase
MPWNVLLAVAMSHAAATDQDMIDRSDLRWRTVHDTVMGGRSSGTWEQTESGIRFQGSLSLENNGGFASLRARSDSLDLSDTSGLTLELVGDGRAWWVTVERSDVPLRAGSYRASVQTRAGEATTHTVRWSDFTPTSFGRPVVGAPSLQSAPERIVQLGWMVADGQPGDFDLEIRSIRADAMEDEAPRMTGAADEDAVTTSFAAAIRLGVPAFNDGDAGRCRAHYQTAIESVLLLAPDQVSEAEKLLLQTALVGSVRQGDVDAAWTLRRAMDTVMRTGSSAAATTL